MGWHYFVQGRTLARLSKRVLVVIIFLHRRVDPPVTKRRYPSKESLHQRLGARQTRSLTALLATMRHGKDRTAAMAGRLTVCDIT